MNHADARELLDVAAVEPGGLDRLMAGDTPTAAALAGHLAGCAACMDEYARLRTSSVVLRDVIATQPPPELRERTLAMIAAVGRPRGAAAQAMGEASSAVAESATASVARTLTPTQAGAVGVGPAGLSAGTAPRLHVAGSSAPAAPGRRGRFSGRMAWLGLAAAIVVASVGATGYAVTTANDALVRQATLELEGMSEVAAWTVRLDAQPDVRRVILTAATPGGPDAQVGTLIFSPISRQMVVVADGMAAPPAGQEYRCWVELGGTRQRLGRMDISGDLAYWVGDTPVLTNIPVGAVFGVSLANVSGTTGPSPAILSGTLQAT